VTFILTGSVQFHSCNQFVLKAAPIYEQKKMLLPFFTSDIYDI